MKVTPCFLRNVGRQEGLADAKAREALALEAGDREAGARQKGDGGRPRRAAPHDGLVVPGLDPTTHPRALLTVCPGCHHAVLRPPRARGALPGAVLTGPISQACAARPWRKALPPIVRAHGAEPGRAIKTPWIGSAPLPGPPRARMLGVEPQGSLEALSRVLHLYVTGRRGAAAGRGCGCNSPGPASGPAS